MKLVARWQLSGPSRSEPLGVFSAETQNPQTIEEGNYDQMVSIMRDMFGELSKQIADTIIEQEK